MHNFCLKFSLKNFCALRGYRYRCILARFFIWPDKAYKCQNRKRTDKYKTRRQQASLLPVNTDVTMAMVFLHGQEVGAVMRVLRQQQMTVPTSITAETYNKYRS